MDASVGPPGVRARRACERRAGAVVHDERWIADDGRGGKYGCGVLGGGDGIEHVEFGREHRGGRRRERWWFVDPFV